jgi:hypothetical protein
MKRKFIYSLYLFLGLIYLNLVFLDVKDYVMIKIKQDKFPCNIVQINKNTVKSLNICNNSLLNVDIDLKIVLQNKCSIVIKDNIIDTNCIDLDLLKQSTGIYKIIGDIKTAEVLEQTYLQI